LERVEFSLIVSFSNKFRRFWLQTIMPPFFVHVAATLIRTAFRLYSSD